MPESGVRRIVNSKYIDSACLTTALFSIFHRVLIPMVPEITPKAARCQSTAPKALLSTIYY